MESGHLLETFVDHKRPAYVFNKVTKKADIDGQFLPDNMAIGGMKIFSNELNNMT
jgi:hypothetical protein